MENSPGLPAVGFVGLGVMGRPMASHLAGAGHALRLFDTAPGVAEALAGTLPGARAARSPAELAAGCDVVVTMVPNGQVVHDLVNGEDGLLCGLARGALLLDTSSSEPWLTERTAALLAARGIAMVDAPVSGAQWGAEAAELVFMVGGAAADVERVRPLLGRMGKAVFHLGGVGAGHAMKCLNNLVTAVNFLAVGEGLAMGARYGLDPAAMVDVLNLSTGMSWISQTHIRQRVVSRSFDDPFKLALMVKDIGIAMELGRTTATPAPLSALAQQLWRAAALQSAPDASVSEFARWLERLSGVEIRAAAGGEVAASAEAIDSVFDRPLMRSVVTGAAGFIGSALIEALGAKGHPDGAAQDELVVSDAHAIAALPGRAAGAEAISGDIAEPALLARLFARPVDRVFHLAGVVSGAAESDFARGKRVNLDATVALLERCRAQAESGGPVVRLVYASSIAVFGTPLPARIDDRTPPLPTLSYGAHKRVCELLIDDYSRRRFVDGRALRLPGVVVRPELPNGALSAFNSDLIREPLAGRDYRCPVGPEATIWITSLARTIANLLHLADLDGARLGAERAVTAPALAVTVGAIVAALGRIDARAPARIRFDPEPALEAQFGRWPLDAAFDRALALGLSTDDSLDALLMEPGNRP